jgi:hypothetical protein
LDAAGFFFGAFRLEFFAVAFVELFAADLEGLGGILRATYVVAVCSAEAVWSSDNAVALKY